jgi:hypothetical protein
MDFKLVSGLTDVETIATGRSIRELPRLRREPLEEDEGRCPEFG